MRLIAKIRQAERNTFRDDDEPGDEENNFPLSMPTLVEIVQQNEEIHLLRLNSSGESVGNTWHASIDAAKEQANLEYEVREADWILLVMRN